MSKKKRPLWKRIPYGAILFYLLYFAGIGACCYGIWFGMGWLEEWLTQYQASQPDVKSEQVFAQRFSEPDWAALYDELGHTDTKFETAEHYARYMEQKIADNQITYYETSAGLSGDHKYVVTAGEEKLATFTLTDMAGEEDMIRDWQYASAEIFYTREKSAWICTDQDVTVYINGVPLDESYLMKTLQTDAEGYLSEEEHGLRRQWMYVDGLLVDPEITAKNAAGEMVELCYSSDSGMYEQLFAPMEISEEERSAVIEAAKVYCRYMIGANESGTLSKYFDKEMDNYKTILYGDNWMQDYKSYNFSEAELTSFYRYSDSHFSVRLAMTLNVKRNNGTIKEYPLDTTFFLKKQEDNWLVYRMTNVEVQEQTTTVLLRYVHDEQVLEDQRVETDVKSLTPPVVETPEGKVFTGWYTLVTDEQGNTTYSLAFMPDEDGNVPLSGTTALEPMILYALFDKEA